MATTTTNYGWTVPTSSDLVKNGATAISTLGQSVDTFLFRPFSKNVILNGGFDIWQRGTSSGTSGWTCADRWYNIVGGTTTFSQDTSVPTGVATQYSYKWTTGASSSYGQYYTAFESAIVKPLRGQSMVFSFWVKTTGTAFTGLLNADAAYSNASDAYVSQTTGVTITGATNITPTSTWTKYSGTLTIPSDAVGFKIGLVPTATQASGVVVYLAAVQLEVGSTATPFSRNASSIQGELAACKRYLPSYDNTAGTNNGFVSGYAYGTNTSIFMVPFDVPARVNPTGMTVSGTINAYALNTSTGVTPTFDAAGINSAAILASHTITAGQGARLGITSGAKLLFTGCEL